MKSTKEIEIELDLLENGLDFIVNSLNPILDSKNELDLKYSVLHISAGMELVLKEVLRKEHWSLIFENIDAANYKHLQSGDFQSASFETILKRLENIADIAITENAKKHFRELRKKRNRIEHFAFKENEAALKSNISKVLSHILKLIRTNLNLKDYSTNSQNQYKEILKKATNFEEYTTLTYFKLKNEILRLKTQKVKLVECPECFQNTLSLNESLECLFCGYTDDPENVAYSYVENIMGLSEYAEIKGGGYFPLENCPHCETRTLLMGITGNNTSICFSCSNEWDEDELSYCDWCNELYIVNERDYGMCENCKDEKMEYFMENLL